jgi:hypothetical protein
MLLLLTLGLARADTMHLAIDTRIGAAATVSTVVYVDPHQSTTVGWQQRAGRRDYRIELVVLPLEGDIVQLAATVQRADTGEVIARPGMTTRIGTLATLTQDQRGRPPVTIAITPTLDP